MKIGFLFQRGGVWVGVHYSPINKRYCINLIPCCTLWVMLSGGNLPYKHLGSRGPKPA